MKTLSVLLALSFTACAPKVPLVEGLTNSTPNASAPSIYGQLASMELRKYLSACINDSNGTSSQTFIWRTAVNTVMIVKDFFSSSGCSTIISTEKYSYTLGFAAPDVINSQFDNVSIGLDSKKIALYDQTQIDLYNLNALYNFSDWSNGDFKEINCLYRDLNSIQENCAGHSFSLLRIKQIETKFLINNLLFE